MNEQGFQVGKGFQGILRLPSRLLQMEVVGFLARFVQLRDSRRWQFAQVSDRIKRLLMCVWLRIISTLC